MYQMIFHLMILNISYKKIRKRKIYNFLNRLKIRFKTIKLKHGDYIFSIFVSSIHLDCLVEVEKLASMLFGHEYCLKKKVIIL